MWGSAFADLAKKAQEAAEQAQATVSTSGAMFNLDSMQQEGNGEATDTTRSKPTAPLSSRESDSGGFHLPHVPAVHMPDVHIPDVHMPDLFASMKQEQDQEEAVTPQSAKPIVTSPTMFATPTATKLTMNTDEWNDNGWDDNDIHLDDDESHRQQQQKEEPKPTVKPAVLDEKPKKVLAAKQIVAEESTKEEEVLVSQADDAGPSPPAGDITAREPAAAVAEPEAHGWEENVGKFSAEDEHSLEQHDASMPTDSSSAAVDDDDKLELNEVAIPPEQHAAPLKDGTDDETEAPPQSEADAKVADETKASQQLEAAAKVADEKYQVPLAAEVPKSTTEPDSVEPVQSSNDDPSSFEISEHQSAKGGDVDATNDPFGFGMDELAPAPEANQVDNVDPFGFGTVEQVPAADESEINVQTTNDNAFGIGEHAPEATSSGDAVVEQVHASGEHPDVEGSSLTEGEQEEQAPSNNAARVSVPVDQQAEHDSVGEEPHTAMQLETEVEDSIPALTDDAPHEAAVPSPIESSELAEPMSQPSPSSQEEQTDEMVPASVLEKYSLQIQRLEEHHNSELHELQRKHEQELQLAMETSSGIRNQAVSERQQLEQQLMEQIAEKESRIQEIMRINEGMELRLDSLKREVEGTQALLAEKESAIGNADAIRDQEKRELNDKLRAVKDSAGTAKADVHQLKEQLQTSKDDLEASNEAYAALKARVKVVATELKERRSECRTLTQNVAELEEGNEQLQTQIANLQSQLLDRDKSQADKEEEMNRLKGRVLSLEDELSQVDAKIEERDVIGEKALSAYKKKAQNSLAIANARATAAQQAKEEAESEVAAAKTASEEAIRKAREAEANGNAALAEAKSYVREMESEQAGLENEVQGAREALDELKLDLGRSREEASAAENAREKLAVDLSNARADLQSERRTTSELQHDVSELQNRSLALYEEIETLREELRRSATASAVVGNAQKDGAADANGSSHSEIITGSIHANEKSDAEATIVMLQRELKDANQAIKELKETLRHTIEQQQGPVSNGGPIDSAEHKEMPEPLKAAGPSRSAGIDSTPLFYAMEKQAELNTAREEINRLANMLGDAQSAKMEAFEAMEEMRRLMEEAQARLERYEKLGPAAKPKHPLSSGANKSTDNHQVELDSSDEVSAAVNLEYLKNVMLQFFAAKTLQEKKALVPVVSSVLCLTAEEQAKAMQSVDQSGSVENVGISLFESIGSKVGVKLV